MNSKQILKLGKVWNILGLLFGLTVILASDYFILKLSNFEWSPLNISIIIVTSLGVILILIALIRIILVKPAHKKTISEIQIDPGEKIVDSIGGIILLGWQRRFKELVPVVGVRKTYTSENALILTNKRVLFITVPIPGVEMATNELYFPDAQWLLVVNEIKEKLKAMIKKQSLKEIANANENNYDLELSEIEKLEFVTSFFIPFIQFRANGKTYFYAIREKESLEKAKQMFKNFIK